MNETLRIYLFGPFEIRCQGKPLTQQDWRSQQTRTITKILLARRGQVVTSDEIIELLWPEDPPEPSRRRLHVRISQLRTALGDAKSVVRTVDGGYLFQTGEGCRVDADEFLEWMREGARLQETGEQTRAIQAYELARQLYRGDFFAEDLYADWAFAGREFYRERFLTLLIELAECYAQQGRYRQAITRLHEALARDPLRETIYVRLMLYHSYAGERSQALQIFDRCRQVLWEELNVAPLDSTIELVDQIRAGTLWTGDEASRYPPPIYEGRLFEVPYTLGETPLVGREREYAWLAAQWRDPQQRVILLEGEAGIGKSRLVEAFAGYLASQGVRVLQARVAPGEQAPLAALADGLKPLLVEATQHRLKPAQLAALARIFPELHERGEFLPSLPALTQEGERQRLYQAMDALAAAATGPHTLLLVDDAHRLSVAAVQVVQRLSEAFPVLLSFRSEETPPAHPLRAAFGSSGLRLEALSLPQVAELIQRLSGRDLPVLAGRISAQSGGNPLFVVSLLQHLFESGRLYVQAEGGWEATEGESDDLPPSVQALIEARLERLPRRLRGLLDLAAVLGGEFDFELMQAASGQAEEGLIRDLDELMDAALLREPRSLGLSEFAIPHDRYTEVIYATLPGVRRKRLHQRAARAIEQLYAGRLSPFFPALADHYEQAGETETTAHYAALAGEQAADQFAHQEALHYLGLALKNTPTQEAERRARLLLAREKIYELQGERRLQESDLQALVALGGQLPQAQRAEIHLRRAGLAWILGQNEAAEVALEEAIQLAQESESARLEAEAWFIKGRVNRDPVLSRKDLEQARRLAQQSGQRAMEGDIVRWLGNLSFWQGRYAQSRTDLEAALKIHREVGDLRGELSALNNLGQVLQLAGDFPNGATDENPSGINAGLRQAAEFYAQALNIARKIGDRLAEGVLLTNLGSLQSHQGDLETAQQLLEQAVRIRDEIGNEEGAAVARKHLGDAARQLGEYERARTLYEQALAINTRIQHAGQTRDALDGLSRLYRELGEYGRARTYCEQALDVRPAEDSPSRVRTLLNGSLLKLAEGQPEEALRLSRRALASAGELPSLQAVALTQLGHALSRLQRDEQAQEHYRQALARFHRLEQPQRAVEPQAGLAQLALVKGDLAEAAAQVEAILSYCDNGALRGTEQVFWVYLTCIQVLQATGDDRAGELLEDAWRELEARAAGIQDDVLRAAFLEQPENAAIARLQSGTR